MHLAGLSYSPARASGRSESFSIRDIRKHDQTVASHDTKARTSSGLKVTRRGISYEEIVKGNCKVPLVKGGVAEG